MASRLFFSFTVMLVSTVLEPRSSRSKQMLQSGLLFSSAVLPSNLNAPRRGSISRLAASAGLGLHPSQQTGKLLQISYRQHCYHRGQSPEGLGPRPCLQKTHGYLWGTSFRIFRLILIGERFFHVFQSLEIMGDLYQYTEAFCHYS